MYIHDQSLCVLGAASSRSCRMSLRDMAMLAKSCRASVSSSLSHVVMKKVSLWGDRDGQLALTDIGETEMGS